MTTITAAAARRTSGFAWFRGWFANSLAAYRREAQIRRTIDELNALSDHELDDIGINRYDIEATVRGQAGN